MKRAPTKRTSKGNREKRSDALAADLRAAAGALVRRLRAESSRQALSMSQGAVLSLLQKKGPSTVADLARVERVTPQSMGAIVGSLEIEGLVERAVDPEDARRWNASLTPAGERVLLEMRAARQAWLSRAIRERLDDDEHRDLAAAVTLLNKLLTE